MEIAYYFFIFALTLSTLSIFSKTRLKRRKTGLLKVDKTVSTFVNFCQFSGGIDLYSRFVGLMVFAIILSHKKKSLALPFQVFSGLCQALFLCWGCNSPFYQLGGCLFILDTFGYHPTVTNTRFLIASVVFQTPLTLAAIAT